MDQRQLEIFDAVMTAPSATEAARRLGVTQPAVSTAMGKLERDVGFTLFRMEGRRLVPSAEARLLHREAAPVLADFRRLDEAVAGISAARAGRLTIASNPSPGVAWLPLVGAAFCRTRPDVRLRFLTRSSDEVRDLATVSAFDLGLAEAPFPQPELVVSRYSLTRVVVLPEAHPLAAHDVLTPKILSGQAMVATVQSTWSWEVAARAFEVAGAHCRIVADCEFAVTAINMVAAGMGLCLVDVPTARSAMPPGLVTRPFRPVLTYDVGLLRPARRPLTRLAEAFAAEIDGFIAPYLTEAANA